MDFKVRVVETKVYIIDVEADNEQEAKESAEGAWGTGDLECNQSSISTSIISRSVKGHYITLDTGAKVEINSDVTSKPSYCRSCGKKIFWGITVAGKKIPLNEDLKTSHFSDCPQSADWRKK